MLVTNKSLAYENSDIRVYNAKVYKMLHFIICNNLYAIAFVRYHLCFIIKQTIQPVKR